MSKIVKFTNSESARQPILHHNVECDFARCLCNQSHTTGNRLHGTTKCTWSIKLIFKFGVLAAHLENVHGIPIVFFYKMDMGAVSNLECLQAIVCYFFVSPVEYL